MKSPSMTVTNVKIEILTRVILLVTYSQYMKELSMSVTSVNIELLHKLILYVTYSQYMKEQSVSEYRATQNGFLTPHIQSINKELSISVTSVNIELLHKVIIYITNSLHMKELSITVTNVNI